MLCRYTKTLSVGEFVIGANGSKHSKSHFILAHRGREQIELAEILYFLECVAITSDNTSVTLWTACVKWYMHGTPLQRLVWASRSSMDNY